MPLSAKKNEIKKRTRQIKNRAPVEKVKLKTFLFKL
jgi:hypothetical protein